MKAVEWVKVELSKIHPYLFVPNLDPAEDDRRLQEFLRANANRAGDEEDLPEPDVVLGDDSPIA
jgi:hypothetical protein